MAKIVKGLGLVGAAKCAVADIARSLLGRWSVGVWKKAARDWLPLRLSVFEPYFYFTKVE